MCTWSAAGSNTFAGVLEVIELDVEMVEQSTECETCLKCLQDHIHVCGPNMHTDVEHEALNTCKCSQNISPFHNFECLQDHVCIYSPNMHTDVKHEALNTCKCSQNITPFCNFKYLQDHIHVHSPNMCTDVCSATESWTAYAYALKCAIHPLESVPFHNSNHDATHQTLTFHHFSTNIRSLQNSVTAGICT